MAPLWTEPIKKIASHNNYFFNRLPEKKSRSPICRQYNTLDPSPPHGPQAARAKINSAGPKKNRAGAKKNISKSSKLY